MKIFKNFSIRFKIVFPLMIMLGCIILLGVLSNIGMQNMNKTFFQAKKLRNTRSLKPGMRNLSSCLIRQLD